MQVQSASAGAVLTAIASAATGQKRSGDRTSAALAERVRPATPAEAVLHGELLRGARPNRASTTNHSAPESDQASAPGTSGPAHGTPATDAARGIALYLVHAGDSPRSIPRIDLKV